MMQMQRRTIKGQTSKGWHREMGILMKVGSECFIFAKKTHKCFTLVNIGCYLEDLDDKWYRYAQYFGEDPGMYL
jgi:hypothetical protein